jgi:hypothetical protein
VGNAPAMQAWDTHHAPHVHHVLQAANNPLANLRKG